MKEYIDLRIVGNKTELGEFLRICQVIQTLGTYGASRKITVSVDGDGSGRLSFGMVNEDGSVQDIPNVPHELFNELDSKKDAWVMDIGE